LVGKPKEKTMFGRSIGTDGRIILKFILGKMNMQLLAGFNWFNVGFTVTAVINLVP
jgi:hypothetical protein